MLFVPLVLAVAATAPGAAAQRAPQVQKPLSIFADPRLAAALGPFEPRAGAWVEYAVVPKRGANLRLRASVLSVLPDGRYWLEIAAQRSDGPPLAMKLLGRGQPGTARDLERAFVFLGGQAPIEVPVGSAADQPPAPRAALPPIRREPPREVNVPAGTFVAAVAKVAGATVFQSAKVPLWRLVKVESRARRVELLGFGQTGATTVFPPGWDDPAQGKGRESVK